jgi:hypothetical protein
MLTFLKQALESTTTFPEFCAKSNSHKTSAAEISDYAFLVSGSNDFFWQNQVTPLLIACSNLRFSPDIPLLEVPNWKEEVARELEKIQNLISLFTANVDNTTDIANTTVKPPWESSFQETSEIPGLEGYFTNFFDFEYYFANPNSSTNANRRRGARVLDMLFCDDLTPINFVPGNDHTQNRHASEAGCASCHYKLDPMAGVFRNIGQFGNQHTLIYHKAMIFDDQKIITGPELQSYLHQWKNTDGNWNSGWVRSLTNPEKNISHNTQTAFGGLDLTTAFKNKENRVQFSHLDKSGKALSAKESFSRLLDRISSKDSRLRMPLGKQM